MKKILSLTPLLFILIIFFGFRQSTNQKNEWRPLFNGKDLSGWDSWLGPPLDDSGKMLSKIPVGLNNDPTQVFTVIDHLGEKVIRISGEKWGGISTIEEFENYHFQLKFKWGASSWGSKKGKKKDSGLLYHAVGKHGADYGAWMRSQEFQIEETNCGDYWGVAGGIEDILATKITDTEFVYDPEKGKLLTFSADASIGRHCKKRSDAEKPTGEWNLLDLYCHGDTSVHVINGQAMMVLVNSRHSINGQQKSLTKGKLQIQSEGAEVFYKDLMVTALQAIPQELLK